MCKLIAVRVWEALGLENGPVVAGAVVRDVYELECDGCVFFFFSSRRRHTRLQGDWSSDVCFFRSWESFRYRFGDSAWAEAAAGRIQLRRRRAASSRRLRATLSSSSSPRIFGSSRTAHDNSRSEERRVGKECRSRWSQYDEKKKNRD